MAVYFSFKHSTVKESIPINDMFITVADLTKKIIEAKKLTRGGNGLVVTDPLTNEDYLDEGTLIRRCSTVLIRRVPRHNWQHPPPIVVELDVPTPGQEGGSCESGDVQYVGDMPKPGIVGGDMSGRMMGGPGFVQGTAPQGYDMSIGMMGGRGFVQGTPPQGYVCYRCRVPGHFIQHCPTNGEPRYDFKRVTPPTGIPKSMLMASTDCSYSLPSGAVAVLKPNEVAFEKEIEGMLSASSAVDFPQELHCPLCKQVMKYAVFTSKCCYESFCDECVREYIITKSMCVCGATDILADHLIPNMTLRDTINRMLEFDYSSTKNSGQNGGSASKSQGTASSATHSMASKGYQVPPPGPTEKITKELEVLQKGEPVSALQQKMEGMRPAKVQGDSVIETTNKSVSSPPADECEQKQASGEEAEKKTKKKAKLSLADEEMQWRAAQDVAAENYTMYTGPEHAAYYPYWTRMKAFMPPYAGAVNYMGIGVVQGGVLPQNPFRGRGGMVPFNTPQRDIAELGMELNGRPPLFSREELQVRKANVTRKREVERDGDSWGQKYGREVSSIGGISSVVLKPKAVSPASNLERQHHRYCDPELPRRPSSKGKLKHNADHNQHQDYRNTYYRETEHHHRDHKDDYRHRTSKRKLSSLSEEPTGASRTHRNSYSNRYENKATSMGTRKSAATLEYESRNSKKRRSTKMSSREREREQTQLEAC